jgi:hypothetical protein
MKPPDSIFDDGGFCVLELGGNGQDMVYLSEVNLTLALFHQDNHRVFLLIFGLPLWDKILQFLPPPKIIVPVLLLGLRVVMKLFVGKEADKNDYFNLLCELPTNIIFLALSFLLVYIFLQEEPELDSMVFFLIFIILAVIAFKIFRHCEKIGFNQITRKQARILGLTLLINYVISLSCLYLASDQLLQHKANGKTEQINEIKNC